MTSTAELLKTEEPKQTEGQTEGGVAKTIEKQTAKIPSDVFLWSALGAIAGAATLRLVGRREDALFVGEWVAPFLLLGVYNKIVKVAGHDRESRRGDEVHGRLANFAY